MNNCFNLIKSYSVCQGGGGWVSPRLMGLDPGPGLDPGRAWTRAGPGPGPGPGLDPGPRRARAHAGPGPAGPWPKPPSNKSSQLALALAIASLGFQEIGNRKTWGWLVPEPRMIGMRIFSFSSTILHLNTYIYSITYLCK